MESVRCINLLMQIKTIYTNLKPIYKLILWFGIVLTIYILYGLNYPKRYFFSCVGTQNVNIFKIIKDQPETKDVLTDSKGYITKEYVSVEKSDSEIVCNKGENYQISFHPYKNLMSENFTFINEKKNEKKFYFAINLNCKKDSNSLN